MKRFLVLMLLVGTAGFLVAGGQGESESAQVDRPIPSISEANPEIYQLPLVSEPTTLTVATIENPSGTVSMNDELPILMELEARTGVAVEYEAYDSASYNETMQTRLAVGQDLPDIVRLPPNPMIYANSGVIQPITHLIYEHAPNIVQLFKERPEIRQSLTAPDGQIYFISDIVDARSLVNYYGFLMRRDWLDRVGLDKPDTIADWYEALSAFKNQDANGNGDPNDEIPLSGDGAVEPGPHWLFPFAGAWGVELWYRDDRIGEGWAVGDDGAVRYEWTNPALRDYLVEMNKWYTEGLIDRDSFVQTGDKTDAKNFNNLVGASMEFTMWTPQWTRNMSQNFDGVFWDVVVPPAGPDGERVIVREPPLSGVNYAISRDAEDPELAIKWLDYIYANPEGQLLVGNYGMEGLTFDYVDGAPQLSELVSSDPEGAGVALWKYGINTALPKILMFEIIQERFYHFEQAQAALEGSEHFVQAFPEVIPSKEETDLITEIMTDIDTYRREMVVKFITGSEPISSFERYVQTIQGMGIERIREIKQAQYDRVK